LFNVLALHPQIYLASSKGLYYFDQHVERGDEWYLGHFVDATDQLARGEISHSYLSSPHAAERIHALNPEMRLLVCLREPVERAFSDYLDLVKNGQHDGTFESAIEQFPRLINRGRYATHLRPYLELFGRDRLHVSLFDDLQADAQSYADRVFAFLGVDLLTLPSSAIKPRMPAARMRSRTAASTAKRASRLAVNLGLTRLRSRVKRSALIRQTLYRPYTEDRPRADPATARELRAVFATEVAALDGLLPTPVSSRWGYAPPV
jgi:hypothetical protein